VVALYEKLGFDRVTTYTDAAGRFHMEGLGPGAFIVQADARPLGFVRTKKRLTLGPSAEGTSLDFELAAGVTIKGTLVDEADAPLAAAGERTFGWVVTEPAASAEEAHASISMTGVRHRLEPANVAGDHVSYEIGEGDDASGTMIFPTASTFLVLGAAPGVTRLGLKIPDREVRRITYTGRDVTTSGLVTTAGQTVEGARIVLGPPGTAGK
jgi:hypothetical protein